LSPGDLSCYRLDDPRSKGPAAKGLIAASWWRTSAALWTHVRPVNGLPQPAIARRVAWVAQAVIRWWSIRWRSDDRVRFLGFTSRRSRRRAASPSARESQPTDL